MRDQAALRALLRRIDGRPYPAYRDLHGAWSLGDLELHVDHVQGDPFAAPSSVRVCVPTGITDLVSPDDHRAAEDWLLRRVVHALEARPGRGEGSGRSGELSMLRPGPEVVWRSAVRLPPDGVAELRLRAGLPARGRRVLGRAAYALLTGDLPQLADAVRGVHGNPELATHRACVCRQAALRRALPTAGLVAFLADGSVLPRASSVDPRPLSGATPLTAPESLAVTVHTDQGPVRGLGLRPGITVLTGGGFHGKSTLLAALATGPLDFLPGDGRERVVSLPRTTSVRAEDGRSVRGVDISAFLTALPGGRSVQRFSTDDASGSTSQAAAMVEALEAGADLLLIDEDTTATNLLFRDARMAALIAREPITPLLSRLPQLSAAGTSTVLVAGGVGDTLSIADRVIGLQDFVVHDWSDRARDLAGAPPPPPSPWEPPADRAPRTPLRPSGKGRVRARDPHRVEFGDELLDLRFLATLRDAAHAASVGQALRLLGSQVDGTRSVPALLDWLEQQLDEHGVDCLSPLRGGRRGPPERVIDGALVRPTRAEVAAALARLRSLRVA